MVNNNTHFKSFLRGKNLLRRILLIALVISSNCYAEADDFSSEYKGVTLFYEILDNGTLYVKGTDNSEITDLEIPSSVTYDGKAYSVTEIGYSAFHNHSSLTTVSLPNSIIKIGGYAFSRCESLTSINLSESLNEIGFKAFSDCI